MALPIPQFTKRAHDQVDLEFNEKLRLRFDNWISSKTQTNKKPIGIKLESVQSSAGSDATNTTTGIATLSNEHKHVYLNNGFEC